jgi:hypothetical protein
MSAGRLLATVWTAIAAVALLVSPAAADGLLANVTRAVRVVSTPRGSSRIATLRATFDAVAPGAFDLRRGTIEVSVGDLPAFVIDAKAKGRRRTGGRVLYRGKKSGSAPFLRRLVVWPVRGQVLVEVGGLASNAPLLTEDPLRVALRLDDAAFTGAYGVGGAAPTGTPVAFTSTDLFPETFVCSVQTFVVGDATVWANLWAFHSLETRPMPPVDFSSEMVVGVFLGPRASRGYGALVTRIEERPSDLLVTFTERRPTSDCTPTPLPICLYAFATTAKSAKPVTFVHKVEEICLVK